MQLALCHTLLASVSMNACHRKKQSGGSVWLALCRSWDIVRAPKQQN